MLRSQLLMHPGKPGVPGPSARMSAGSPVPHQAADRAAIMVQLLALQRQGQQQQQAALQQQQQEQQALLLQARNPFFREAASAPPVMRQQVCAQLSLNRLSTHLSDPGASRPPVEQSALLAQHSSVGGSSPGASRPPVEQSALLAQHSSVGGSSQSASISDQSASLTTVASDSAKGSILQPWLVRNTSDRSTSGDSFRAPRSSPHEAAESSVEAAADGGASVHASDVDSGSSALSGQQHEAGSETAGPSSVALDPLGSQESSWNMQDIAARLAFLHQH
jgi:hypothetical protein